MTCQICGASTKGESQLCPGKGNKCYREFHRRRYHERKPQQRLCNYCHYPNPRKTMPTCCPECHQAYLEEIERDEARARAVLRRIKARQNAEDIREAPYRGKPRMRTLQAAEALPGARDWALNREWML